MSRIRFVPVLISALVVGCGGGEPTPGAPHGLNDDDPSSDGSGGEATTGSGGEATSGSGGEATSGSGGEATSGSGGEATTGSGGDATTTTGAGGGGQMISTPMTPVYDHPLMGAGQSYAQSMATAPNDDVVVVGTFSGSSDFGCGALVANDNDIFVARYSASGSCLWSKKFGSDSNPQLGASVAVDPSGNVLLAGTFIGDLSFGGATLDSTGTMFSDVYVAKLDPNGAHVWSKRFGDIISQEAHAVAVDSAGNVIVTGMFQGEIDFGGSLLSTEGDRDAFLLKLESDGDHVFSKQFGDDEKQNGLALAVAADGSIVLGGYSQGDVDFGGGELDNANDDQRAFLAWFSATGAHVVSDLYEGGAASIDALAFTPSGDLLVGGNFKGSIDLGGGMLLGAGAAADDIVVGRFDASASLIDAVAIGDAYSQRLTAIASDANGAAVIGGRFTGSLDYDDVSVASQGNFDGFVLKLDATQGHRFFTFGDASYQSTTGLGRNAAGEVLAVGDFSGVVDFGSGGVTGDQDSFVAAYLP